jgi:hypothetical protein
MDRRTSLITVAAVAAAILAGGTAIAANVGVLGAAGDDPIGELTAVSVDAGGAGEPPTSVTTSAATAVTASLPPSSTQQFQVEAAGMVTIRRVSSGIELDEVTTASGWSWALDTDGGPTLVVRFTSSDTTYVFTAEPAADGAVTARVDQVTQQPSAGTGQPAAPTPTSATGDDDEYEDHEYEDHDEYEEHEGGDDDD